MYTGKYSISRRLTKHEQPPGGYVPPWQPTMVTCRVSSKRFYAPFRQSPVLHRIFSNLSGDHGIIDFASSYGFLDYSQCVFIKSRGDSAEGTVVYEPLEKWRKEIRAQKAMLARWDFVRGRSEVALGRVIDWRADGVYFTLGRQSELIAGSGTTLYSRWLRQGKALQEPAFHYIYSYINSRIRGGVFPEALPAHARGLYLIPDNLLTAMWVMFMWEIIGETRPCSCTICGGWFNPRRSTRKTCSDRCRKRLSRAGRSLPRVA